MTIHSKDIHALEVTPGRRAEKDVWLNALHVYSIVDGSFEPLNTKMCGLQKTNARKNSLVSY